jgi:predicted RNase H-like HicB family nuclease
MGKRRFTVVLLPQEEGGYQAFFPYHPNCFVWGDTPEETLHRAQDAIIAHLEALADEELDLNLDLVDLPHVVIGNISVELSERLEDVARREAEEVMT